MKALISIVTITFNHVDFVEKCIQGVLMQKVGFPIEFIIADDCSTDGTIDICRKYAERFPDIIKFLPATANMGYLRNELRAMEIAEGKYIAYCEGDDYWTDPHKLQKQFDFMEANEDYSVCFHRCKHLDISTGTLLDDRCGDLFQDGENGVDIQMQTFFSSWFTQPLTMLIRKSCFELKWYGVYPHYRDMHQIYHLLKNGKGRILPFYGGIRTMHPGGIASQLDIADQCSIALEIAKELYHNNKDEATRAYYASMLQWYLFNIGSIKKNRLKYSLVLFYLTGNLKMMIHNILRSKECSRS